MNEQTKGKPVFKAAGINRSPIPPREWASLRVYGQTRIFGRPTPASLHTRIARQDESHKLLYLAVNTSKPSKTAKLPAH